MEFENDLAELSNIDWQSDPENQVNKIMEDIVTNPLYFAEFLELEFVKANSEFLEQLKGILFFIVHRYPEIFILIRMYLYKFGESLQSNLKTIIETYSYFLQES